MLPDQLRNVAVKYEALLQERGAVPVRADTNQRIDTHQKLCHAMWMCEQIQAFVGLGEMYKANRWLGFVQGVMSSFDMLTVDEMREDNRS